jgi:hypothetical protein
LRAFFEASGFGFEATMFRRRIDTLAASLSIVERVRRLFNNSNYYSIEKAMFGKEGLAEL